MLIGVDLCNTVANVNYELLKRFNNLSFKKYPFPEVPKDFFESPEGLKIFMDARPFYRSQEMLYRLISLGYQVVYMTSRPQLAEFVTRRWLDLNGFPSGLIEFVPSNQKAERAYETGMVAFFDDDPFVIQGLINKGSISVFVKAAPYNNHIQSPNIVRFKEWVHIRPLLNGLKKVRK